LKACLQFALKSYGAVKNGAVESFRDEEKNTKRG
jgi:hypothetical protein